MDDLGSLSDALSKGIQIYVNEIRVRRWYC